MAVAVMGLEEMQMDMVEAAAVVAEQQVAAMVHLA
jgi:hypothetical protein